MSRRERRARAPQRGFAGALCVLLGAAAACGFAPLGLWPLTLACLAAWLALVAEAPRWRTALWRGWLFGVGHFTVNDNWFQHAFDFQQAMPPVLGYLAPLALALYLAVYPMAAAALIWRPRERPGAAFAFVAAAAWIATEWLRATLFTGYAWDPLGVIWVPVQPVAALSAWIGTYALSGLTVLAAGLVLAAVRSRRAAALGGVAAALALGLAAQALSYRAPPASPLAPGQPRLVVVQPNVGQDERGESDAELLLRRLSALSGRPGAGPRLVMWPEGVLRDFIEDGYPDYLYAGRPPGWVRARLASLLGPNDLLLAGGQALRFDAADEVVGAGNTIYAITPDARIAGRYDKAHLVPYGEYLPMPWLLRPLGLARLVPGDVSFDPGPGPRTLPLPGFGAVGMQLCYEIIFSGVVVDPAHRPALLFNPSNDAWFGAWGPPQHLAQARLRAIEEGLPIVRATPTGISAVIAADGRLVATVPAGRAGSAEVAIPHAAPPTLFARLGNRLAAAVALLLAATGLALRRRAARPRGII